MATPTLNGPATQPVQVSLGQTTSVPVTVNGPYSGNGINPPTGSVSYSILNSANTSVASGTAAISSGAPSIPLVNTLRAGNYTVQLTYAGDANYTAAAAI